MTKTILFGPYPPPYGGVAIYVYTLNEFLKQFGFNCSLEIYRQRTDLNEEFVYPEFNSVLRRFWKITNSDTCVDSSGFFLSYPSLGATVAWLLIKVLRRFRWLKIIHDGSLPFRYHAFRFSHKLLFQISIRFVDEFIVVGEDLRDWLQKTLKIQQKVSLVKSLLPIPKQTLEICLPVEIQQSISHYEKLITSIGVFIPDYGFEYIANAVEVIRQQSATNIGLLLINGSFTNDETYKSKALKDRKWIVVLENVPHAQVLQILKKSDVFIRGSAFESYGLSRVEALWSGTPVVATRVGETRGMLLYDFGNEKELIRQIKRALLNPPSEDIKAWGNYFHQEANDNLMTLISLIDPGRRHICLVK